MWASRSQRLYLVGSGPSQVAADLLTLAVTVAPKTDLHPDYGLGATSSLWLGGSEAPTVRLAVGQVLRLDQSHASNAGYGVRFYADADKGGDPLGTAVGVPGQAGAHVELVIESLPLHYQAVDHARMGGAVLEGASPATETVLTQLATVSPAYAWVRQADLRHALVGPGLLLDGLDLSRASLAGLDLTGVSLTSIQLVDADFRGATLSGTTFDGSNLSGALMDAATTVGTADFTGADLTGARLDGADLTACVLRRAVPETNGDSWDGDRMQSGNRLRLDLAGFAESQRALDGFWTQIAPSDRFFQLVGRSGGADADLAGLAVGPVLRHQRDQDLLMLPTAGGFGDLPEAPGAPRWAVVTTDGGLVATGPAVTAQPRTFAVTVAAKTAAHPHHGAGSGLSYLIDGVEAASFALVRGVRYTFDNSANPSHPLRFSQHPDGRVGGAETGQWTDGYEDDGSGVVHLTLPASAPATLHYYCGHHPLMGGGTVTVQDQAASDAVTFASGETWAVHDAATGFEVASTAVTVVRTQWLRTARLERCSAVGADLSGQDLTGVPIGGADLSGAALASARLEGADLQLDVADVASLVAEQRLRRRVRVVGRTAGGGPLPEAGVYTWDGVDRYARTDGASWRLQGGTTWTLFAANGATLLAESGHVSALTPSRTAYAHGHASFAVVADSVLLTGLSGADLSSAVLSHADLSQHDLRGCTLALADLEGVRLAGAALDPAAVWGASGELGGVAASGVVLPRVVSSGSLTAHALPSGGFAFRQDGAPVLATLASGTVQAGVTYAVTASSGGVLTLSNGATLASGQAPDPSGLPTPSADHVWLAGPGGVRTLVGPGVDLRGVDTALLAGLDGVPSASLQGAQLHGLVGGQPGAAPAGYAWVQNAAGEWALVGPGLSYERADLSGADLTAMSGVSMAGVRASDGATLPAGYAFASLSDGSQALFGPGADLRGARLGGLTSVGGATVSGMLVHGVRMTEAEFAALQADPVVPGHVWVEQPEAQALDGSKRYALLGPGVDVSGADLRKTDLRSIGLQGLDLAGARISGIRKEVRDGSAAGSGYNWVEVVKGAEAGTFAMLGPGVVVEADLRGAQLADLSLAGTDLSGGTFADTRVYNITDRTGTKLPSGAYEWVDQGGGKELLAGPGMSLQGAVLDGADFAGKVLDGMNFSQASLRGVEWSRASVRDVPADGTVGAVFDDGFAFAQQANGKYALVGPGVDMVGLELAPAHPDLGQDIMTLRRAGDDWVLSLPASLGLAGGDVDIALDAAVTADHQVDTRVHEGVQHSYRFEMQLLGADGGVLFPFETYYAYSQGVSVLLRNAARSALYSTATGLSLERGRTYRFDVSGLDPAHTLRLASAGDYASATVEQFELREGVLRVGASGDVGAYVQLTTSDAHPVTIYAGGSNAATAKLELPPSSGAAAEQTAAVVVVHPLTPAEEATLRFRVRVAGDGGFRLRRPNAAAYAGGSSEVVLVRGHTYAFEQNDPSCAGNPLRFTTSSDPAAYRYGYVRGGMDAEGVPGDLMGGAFLSFTVPADQAQDLYYVSDRYGPTAGNLARVVDAALHSAEAFADGNVLLRAALAPGAGPWQYALDDGAPVEATDPFVLLTGLSAGTHTVQVAGEQVAFDVPQPSGVGVTLTSAPAVDAQGRLAFGAASGTGRWAYRVDELLPAGVPVGQETVLVDLAGSRTSGQLAVFATDPADGTRLAVALAAF